MRRTVLTVAALGLLGAAYVSAAPKANPGVASASLSATQNQSKTQNQVQTFTGTIVKTGDEFVFSDDATKSAYQLDDQKAASKFDGKRVKVTGTLDAANNMIKVQSIEPVSA
ncbi:MAG TPA: DUF5818 domain-containing protein [Candidatus Acidoferrales bacterium]|nr:DUF5818 domain-containing protein [Candidatus Acidoferrales bacterium]